MTARCAGMMTDVRHFPRRLAVAVVLVALLLSASVRTTVSARADTQEPTPVVTVQADRSVEVDDAVRVSVARATSGRTITINWGDGARTKVRGRCTPAQARSHPRRCGVTARHAYQRAGVFRIKVSRDRLSVAQALMRVAGSVAATAQAAGNWRLDMLLQVNALRKEVGAPPVTLCTRLTSAAQEYASLMASQDHYGHVGPDGSQPWERMAGQGYRWTAAAENIAGGYGVVIDVMNAWHDSPGHYTNIINPDLTHVGFGFATDPDSTYQEYWVQDFGTGGSCSG